MSSIFGSPRRWDPLGLKGWEAGPMHLDIANGGRGGPLLHANVQEDTTAALRGVRPGDETWHQTVLHVLRWRRNAIARSLQRWACRFEMATTAHARGGMRST